MGLWDKSSDATTIEELRDEWKDCTQCPFHVQRTQVVFGAGTAETAEIFAVGQYPGADEDQCGIPFSGRGGQVTKVQFDLIGIPKDKVWWTNALACKPFKHLQVRKTWMEHCWDRLEAELTIVRPKLIVAMGAPATRRFILDLPAKAEARGRQFVYRGIPGISIIHPAAVLRARGRRRQEVQQTIADDFQQILQLYRTARSAKSS
jgi:DNA polymerase